MTSPRSDANPSQATMSAAKLAVKAHWEEEVCGSRYGADAADDRRRYFAEIESTRYKLDWMIPGFARFTESRGKRVLELGLGTGTDFLQWVRAGAIATGRDLTTASVELVKERLGLENRAADVAQGDAEALEFPDDTFDIFYSWGVLHHSPDTTRAVGEAYRVLRPGGELRIMVYHWPSVVAFLVWLAQGILRFRLIGPRKAVALHLESPGTKLYTRKEAHALVARHFPPASIHIETRLCAGDLLTNQLSSRYRNPLWRIVSRLYPRWFVRNLLGDRFGLFLMITARK
jgi:ubiquinone/menaquinone biosynthesis C-methylase UbiE